MKREPINEPRIIKAKTAKYSGITPGVISNTWPIVELNMPPKRKAAGALNCNRRKPINPERIIRIIRCV